MAPRVLHVAETISGGIATYLDNLVASQAKKFGEDSVRVLVPENQKVHLHKLPASVVVTYPRESRWVGLPALRLATARTIRTFAPNIVHAHSSFAGLIVRTLPGLRCRGVDVVYCPHGWSFDMRAAAWKLKLYRAAELGLVGRTDAIIMVSESELSLARGIGIPEHLLHLVPNGIPDDIHITGQGPEWRQGRRRVLFVGRLDLQKGYDVLVEAVRGLGDTLDVVVIGAYVVNRAAEIAAEPHVRKIGWQDPGAIAEWIDSADLLVAPSRWEAFGLVALEAMRAGKPVVASDVGGLREVVLNGETGVLVPPENPQALATALRFTDSSTLGRMGKAGRDRYLEFYSLDLTCSALFKIYSNLADGRSSESKGSRETK